MSIRTRDLLRVHAQLAEKAYLHLATVAGPGIIPTSSLAVRPSTGDRHTMVLVLEIPLDYVDLEQVRS